MGAGTAQGGACLLISGKVRKNMEFVVFAGVLLLLFIFMIVQELIQTKNQEKLFKKYLRENYGKEPPKEYSLERFARLGSYLERHKEEKQLDDITWNDLGMDEVFRRIDRTYSAGERNICTIRSGIFPAGERHWNIWKKWLTGCRSRRI